jgi:tricarballylate dehydrogenase
MQTVNAYNAACRVGSFDHTVLDDCHTEGLSPPKTHWARPSTRRRSTATRCKPGHHLHLPGPEDRRAGGGALRRPAQPNLFAAGEVMAGNVLGKGYTAGVGMTIGTVRPHRRHAAAPPPCARRPPCSLKLTRVPHHPRRGCP